MTTKTTYTATDCYGNSVYVVGSRSSWVASYSRWNGIASEKVASKPVRSVDAASAWLDGEGLILVSRLAKL